MQRFKVDSSLNTITNANETLKTNSRDQVYYCLNKHSNYEDNKTLHNPNTAKTNLFFKVFPGLLERIISHQNKANAMKRDKTIITFRFKKLKSTR